MQLHGMYYILYEYYCWSKRKGAIGYSRIDPASLLNNSSPSIDHSGILLENSFHLSYPYTLSISTDVYFIPENNTNGANLYRVESTAGNTSHLTSVFVKTLLDGYCVDPTYIRLNGYDYLFVTRIDETGMTLHLYFCKDILKDDLVKHPASPLCVDHSLGRSAGRIFVESETEGIIIRPSQIMKERYGQGLLFSQYKLDHTECRLIAVQKKIKPPSSSLYSRIHHVDHLSGLTVIDFMR